MTSEQSIVPINNQLNAELRVAESLWHNACLPTAPSIERDIIIPSHTELQAEIYIPAAPAVVWQTFRQIETWHHWYPDVLAVSWEQGLPWEAHSQMRLHVKNSLGRSMSSLATVQPSTPEVLVWENRMPGLITLCHAQVFEIATGSKFTLHKSYHGAAALLMRILKSRQERLLGQGLENLERLVMHLSTHPHKA